MPGGGIDLVGGHAAAGDEQAGEAVLGDGVALGGGAAEIARGLGFARRNAVAVEEQDGVFHLADRAAVPRRALEQAGGLRAHSRRRPGP